MYVVIGEAEDDETMPSDEEEGREESGGVSVGEDSPKNIMRN
jgi:hypothetical protein